MAQTICKKSLVLIDFFGDFLTTSGEGEAGGGISALTTGVVGITVLATTIFSSVFSISISGINESERRSTEDSTDDWVSQTHKISPRRLFGVV
jgi:hypothetical protein